MLPLSGLAWSLLAKCASAFGLATWMTVETLTGSTGESSTGLDDSLRNTRELRLIPEVLLDLETVDTTGSLLPSLSHDELQLLPSLGVRRFHNILEVGLTFGGAEAIELRDEAGSTPTWLQGMGPADTAEIESLTLRLSWEI